MLGSAHRGRATVRRAAAVLLVAVMAQWSCSARDPSHDDRSDDGRDAPDLSGEAALAPELFQARLASVPATTTVMPTDGPTATSAAASQALFDHAPVVVLAADGAAGPQAQAASAALALGAPLLLSPIPADDAAATEAGTGAGFEFAGYNSQEAFLIGNGLQQRLEAQEARAPNDTARFALRREAQQLTLPAAMGERFQAMGFERGVPFEAAFLAGDLSFRL